MTQPALFPEAPVTPAPERCTVDTSGARDVIVPCRVMAWMLDADKRCFRMTGTMIETHTGRTRDAVVVDLMHTRDRSVWYAVVVDLMHTRDRSVWYDCEFCPFCGASIATRFRDKPTETP